MEKAGSILGIPCDLRPPTRARIRERIWNPDNPRIIVPRVFGAGWTINLGRLKQENEILFWAAAAIYAYGLLKLLRRMFGKCRSCRR